MNPISFECARLKFEGSKPYSKHSYFYETVDLFLSHYDRLPVESLVGFWSESTPDKFTLKNAKLIESLCFDDGSYFLMVLKRYNESMFLTFPNVTANNENIKGITFSFICTATDPYLSFLMKAIEWYHKMGCEISVILFGDANLPSFVRVEKHSMLEFDMAFARNRSLKNATNDHIFMLDVDVFLTNTNVYNIMEKYRNLNHHGVFNLKNGAILGNGLYFGNRHIMMNNGYLETFKKCWYEDTEFLMNFSRIGILPTIVFEDFKRVDHERKHTMPSSVLNQTLFVDIFLNGERPHPK